MSTTVSQQIVNPFRERDFDNGYSSGVIAERERCLALIQTAAQSGDVFSAIAAIENGDPAPRATATASAHSRAAEDDPERAADELIQRTQRLRSQSAPRDNLTGQQRVISDALDLLEGRDSEIEPERSPAHQAALEGALDLYDRRKAGLF